MMSEGSSKKKEKEGWREVLKEYSYSTTLHGLRYIADEEGVTTRKLSWITVVLLAASIMTYFIVAKLIFYYKYPTMIDLEIEYKTSLQFPAVAICNQNPYTMTSLHKGGLYDVVASAFAKKNDIQDTDESECHENYLLLDNICSVPWTSLVFASTVNEVTSEVCRHLCSTLESERCSGYLYQRDSRSCVLTSFTGGATNSETCDTATSTFYRRLRCPHRDPVHCTYLNEEPENHCFFEPDKDGVTKWQWATSDHVDGTHRDHTVDSEHGGYMAMLNTDRYPGHQAKLDSPFVDTTGSCLMLFYTHLDYGIGQLTVSQVNENLNTEILAQRTGNATDRTRWLPLFVPLPSGIHSLRITGERLEGASGFLIDDVTVVPCEELKQNCKYSPSGDDYIGNISRSRSGKTCLPWTDFPDVIGNGRNVFPDQSPEDAKNYCRNLDSRPAGPYCMTGDNEEALCDIPYCECTSDSADWFQCPTSGRCIPSSMLCDGEYNCEDGIDELHMCRHLITMECSFETDYMCGYSLAPSGGFRWQRIEDDTWSDSLDLDLHLPNKFYMQLLSEGGAAEGDITTMKSPPHTFEQPSLLAFHVKMYLADDDTQTKLTVLLTNPLGTVLRELLTIKQRGDDLWVKYYVCIPKGTYSVQFDAIKGITTRPFIALDSVSIVTSLSHPDVPHELPLDYYSLDYSDYSDGGSGELDSTGYYGSGQWPEDGLGLPPGYGSGSTGDLYPPFDLPFDDDPYETNAGGPFAKYAEEDGVMAAVKKCVSLPEVNDATGDHTTVDCGFSTKENCGYFSQSGSLYFQWQRIPKDFLEKAIASPYTRRGCEGHYYETEGYIESPGYPVSYDNYADCRNHIVQPDNSKMTLTFEEFSLEQESSCSYDSLELGHLSNQSYSMDGALYCGDTLPPVSVRTKQTVVLHLRTDLSVTYQGYRLHYETADLDTVDYVIAASYHGGYNEQQYTSRLSSQAFTLEQSHCLTFDVYRPDENNTQLHVLLVYRRNYTGEERPLLSSFEKIGNAWHRAAMTVHVTDDDTGVPMYLAFDSVVESGISPAYSTALDNVHLQPGRCQDLPIAAAGSAECDFKSIDMCGYVDISEGPSRWLRSFSSGLQDYFVSIHVNEKTDAKLLSPPMSVSGPACLVMEVKTGGSYVKLTVAAYHNDSHIEPLSVERLAVVKQRKMGTVKVALPTGSYRVLFDVTAANAHMYIYSVSISHVSCKSTGKPPIVDDSTTVDTTAEIPPVATDSSAADNKDDHLPHPVSDLSRGILEEKTYNALLDAADVSLTELVEGTAQSLDDLVLECKWNGRDCQADHIRRVHTDMGYCMVFNGHLEDPLTVTKPGADNGLKLTLNIAQYDYMKGLTTDAGVKVQVLHQSETPNMRNKGLAVGSGMHAIINLGHIESEHLSHPYGTCGERELDHFPNKEYTYSACETDCETSKLEHRCACRDLYMPEISPYTVCSSKDFLDCVIQTTDTNHTDEYECEQCPAACITDSYDMQLSYATISTLSINTLLAEHKDKIVSDFHRATDTFHRLQKDDLYATLGGLSGIIHTIDDTVQLLRYDALDASTSIYSRVEEGVNNLNAAATEDLQKVLFANLDAQVEAYKAHLKTGRQALYGILEDEERSRNLLLESVNMQDEYLMSGMVDPALVHESYQLLLSDAVVKLKIAMTKLSSFYFQYHYVATVDDGRFEDMLLDRSLPSLLIKDRYERVTCDQALFIIVDQFGDLLAAYENLQQVYNSENIYQDNYENNNEDSSGNGYENNSRDAAEHSQSSVTEYWEVVMNMASTVETPTLRQCLVEYEELLSTIVNWNGSVAFSIPSYSATFGASEELEELDSYNRFAQELLSRFSTHQIDMFDLIEMSYGEYGETLVLKVEKIRTQIQQSISIPTKAALVATRDSLMLQYVAGLQHKADLAVYFDRFASVVLDPIREMSIWREPYANLDHPKIVSYHLTEKEARKKLPANLQTYAGKSDSAKTDVKIYLKEFFDSLASAVDNLDAQLLVASKALQTQLSQMYKVLDKFKGESEIGASFIRQNFLKMDMYFAEMKSSSLEQKKEYKISTFFSDMGGYMGLLLGASVVTFVELLDLLLTHCCSRRSSADDQRVEYSGNKNWNGGAQRLNSYYLKPEQPSDGSDGRTPPPTYYSNPWPRVTRSPRSHRQRSKGVPQLHVNHVNRAYARHIAYNSDEHRDDHDMYGIPHYHDDELRHGRYNDHAGHVADFPDHNAYTSRNRYEYNGAWEGAPRWHRDNRGLEQHRLWM